MSAYHLSPDGSSVALTARGRAFVAPVKQGRFVEIARFNRGPWRDTRFMPDGKTLLTLADSSGEVELWTTAATGLEKAKQLTTAGDVLRFQGLPSPDGKWIAVHDKNQCLQIYDAQSAVSKTIETSKIDEFGDLAWSPDSKWLAYVISADILMRQLKLYSVETDKTTIATSNRFESYSPAWSPDGRWLYFLSDRNLKTIVPSPWGSYQPEPYLDRRTKIYQLALADGLRSPFAPFDELHPEKKDEKKEDKKDVVVKIELEGLQKRLQALPVGAGNYGNLTVNDKAIFWLSSPPGESKSSLSGIIIGNENVEVKTVVADVKSYELSQDGKKLAVMRQAGDSSSLLVLDAIAAPADLTKKEVNLSGWSLSVNPRDEWRQMFVEAWRLERDYFYDRNMHGTDWKAILKKYEPLVDRVHSRAELSDLTAQMVSELSALHIFVRGGDVRKGGDQVQVATLGADLERDRERGGYLVRRVYQSDPDTPERASPLVHADVKVKEGDVIEAINGNATLGAPDIETLLQNKAGQQVLLRVKTPGGNKTRSS